MDILSGLLLLLRSVFWTILVPGTVTVYIPHLIVTRSSMTIAAWGPVQFLSLMVLAIGAGILLHCIWNFAVHGRGTLSPLDAPRRLVVQGLYRYVRNPMYVGVVLILLGEALLFESLLLLEYAGAFFLAINLVILLIEEPMLRGQFSQSYERYCREVGRWWPGKPYDGGGP